MDRPEEPGTLYLVATPIGNLEDITLRALRVLKEADLIAAEDTRRTRKLLSHYGISRPLVSCHEHNEQRRIPVILEKLRSGKSVALVSDAGSPGVSDPGFRIACALLREGIPFTAVPGPSAVITALSLAGIAAGRFAFYGFLPRTGSERLRILEEAAGQPLAMVFYEAPHRIARTVAEMREVLGDREAALCRELTKRFEEILRGTLSEILEKIGKRPPRGELCLVVSGPGTGAETEADREETLRKVREEIGLFRAGGQPLKQAAASLARKYGLSRREVYQLALERPAEAESPEGPGRGRKGTRKGCGPERP